jgi:dCTP deaminase
MVVPYQMLIEAARGRAPIIKAPHFIDEQFQPATIDLRLGDEIHAVSTAFLPSDQFDSVADAVKARSHYSFTLSPDKTHHLDIDKIYMVPLVESCDLPDNTRMLFSPKSSVGRNDVFVQIVVERYRRYNRTPWGYKGRLWAQITPQSFHVGVRAGLRLVQGRIMTRSSHTLTTDELQHLHTKHGIALGADGKPLPISIESGKVEFHIDLQRDIAGFRAKRRVSTQLDLSAKPDTYDPRDFFEPLYRTARGELVLDPGEFYLLSTVERIRIPPECCAELVPVMAEYGEFRVHYAGLFDNGFGGRHGTHGVLEVRATSVPFMLEHGNPVCAMSFERTFEVPTKLYGEGGSSYTESAPSLAKIFAHRYDAWKPKFWAGRF